MESGTKGGRDYNWQRPQHGSSLGIITVDTCNMFHTHTLQLVVKGLKVPAPAEVLSSCRKIVGHFKHSCVASRALEAAQIRLGLPQHHLLQEVSTRWNSSYPCSLHHVWILHSAEWSFSKSRADVYTELAHIANECSHSKNEEEQVFIAKKP